MLDHVHRKMDFSNISRLKLNRADREVTNKEQRSCYHIQDHPFDNLALDNGSLILRKSNIGTKQINQIFQFA